VNSLHVRTIIFKQTRHTLTSARFLSFQTRGERMRRV
jgi:hypothetical protein